MKKILQVLAVVMIGASMTGCATSPYLTDRTRDAADIFTCTVGLGAGAKARVGPLQVGVFGNADIAGLRGGECFTPNSDIQAFDLVSPLPLPGIPHFLPSWTTAVDCFDVTGKTEKGYVGHGRYLPIITVSDRVFYYSQMEVAFGLGVTLRFGFNPGELVDFLLGWIGIDIFDDDIAARKPMKYPLKTLDDKWQQDFLERERALLKKEREERTAESNKLLENISTNAPSSQQ